MEEQLKLTKKPWIEHAYIWLDRIAKGLYPDEIYNYAYFLMTINAKNTRMAMPHAYATTALYIACTKYNIGFDFKRINATVSLYLTNKKIKRGIKMGATGIEAIQKRASKWKLNPE